jgi:Fur family zinc uptake transcriptional regulator
VSQNIIQQAAVFCKEQGHRYTEPRAHVLKILSAAGVPLGAYDILKELSKKLPSPKPPTVYRAIQFWQTHGFIHCIESQKTYVACSGNHSHTGTQFLVCEHCGDTKELSFPEDSSIFLRQAKRHEFTLSFWTTELRGTCKKCRKKLPL